jgi:hypothetical protein
MTLATIAGLAIGLTPPGLLMRVALLGTLGAVGAAFRSLTIEVRDQAVHLSFGDGVIKKIFPVSEIDAAKQVRTTPLNGWGIHWIGNGWLYNIYGLDAIELAMKDGKRVWLGTDDPENLLAAIKSSGQHLITDQSLR